MKTLFPHHSTPPAPSDVARILQFLEQIVAAQKSAASQAAANQAYLKARLDQIEAELNPPTFPTSLQFMEFSTMGIVTSINLTAGGSSDEIVVEDENDAALPQSTITWLTSVGESSPANLTVAAATDGSGFTFTAGAAAPTEAVTVTATWTDPAGVAAAVTSGPLTVNITAAVVSTAPTSLQFNEVSGS